MIECVEKIFNEISKSYPDFQQHTYDTTGQTIYFGLPPGTPGGKSGNGFKLYKQNNKWILGVKKDLKTGKLTDLIFELPKDYEKAKIACFNIYDIRNIVESFKDKISKKDHNLKDEFLNELSKTNIEYKEKISKNYFGYYFVYNDVFTAFRISKEEENLVLKIKKFAPLDDSKNTEDDGTKKYYLKNNVGSKFKQPINSIIELYNTCSLFEKIAKEKLIDLLKETLIESKVKISKEYCTNNEYTLILENNKKINIFKDKNEIVASVFKNDKENDIFIFDKEKIPEIIKFLLGKKDTTVVVVGGSPKQPTIEKNVQKLSESGKSFVKDIMELPSNPGIETINLYFEIFDNLSDDDLKNNDIIEAYRILCSYVETEEPNTQIRFVYVSKTFLKEIEEISEDLKQELNTIFVKLSTLKGTELNEYLVSKKRLCYIYNYQKIRIKQGVKDRIIFCYGDKLGKNKKDIYIFSYNSKHKFDNIPNLHPESQQYSLWKGLNKQTKGQGLPPLTKKQEEISNKINNPIICTGCAGSGKTLISVYMYLYILDKVFNSDQSISENNLIYITYNDNARMNAINQLNDVIQTVNAKSVFQFLYSLAKPDLKETYKYSNEEDFIYWWKNKITDHSLKIKMNSLANDAIRYVYTLFRGIYKGSMYRWELTYNTVSLSKQQFLTILSNEPIEKEKAEFIYHICKMYQDYMTNNEMFDDNDLARIVSRRANKGHCRTYNHIIVDEVQDLTEVQLDAIVKCSKDKKCLYFFGDQNQSINPTILDLNNIEMCLQSNDSTISHDNISKLTSSYRFGPLLAKYINKLINLKKQWIGAQAIDELESSNKYPEKNKWAGKSKDKELIKTILKKVSNSSNAIIIVPDNKVKEELKNNFGNEIGDRITTIFDSKGLEWDYVVMYNMLKFNEEKFIEMINSQSKHSTLHRMIFNQYYVGCTRALSCFSVLEEDLNENVENAIIGSLQTITKNNIDLYLNESMDDNAASWFSEAERLYSQNIYDLALAAFNKAKVETSEEPRITICEIMLDKDKCCDIKNAEFCKANRQYKEASKIYFNSKNLRLSKLMDLYCGINITEQEAWDILNNEKLTSKDIETLNINGYFTRKSAKIKAKISDLINSFGG